MSKELFTNLYGLMTQNDFAGLFLGELLGTGTYRDVYSFAIDTSRYATTTHLVLS